MTTVDPLSLGDVDRLYDELYERYGVPFEANHLGEYLAIAPDGRALVDPPLIDAVRRAAEDFGPGVFLYKVGERAVGTWR